MIKTISKAALLAVVASSLTAALATPAQAQVSVAEGRRCGFASEYDPTTEGDVQRGAIQGGPLTASAPGATIELTCTIQSGAANSTHAGTDAASAKSGATLQTAVVPPTPIQYIAPEGQPVYMCSQATINGIDYFWDATVVNPGPPATAAGWTTSSSAACNEAISQETFPRGEGCDQPVKFNCYYDDGTGLRYCTLWVVSICLIHNL